MAGVKRGRTATSTNLVDLQTEVLEKDWKKQEDWKKLDWKKIGKSKRLEKARRFDKTR